jgi:hypothetical protein
LKKRFLPILWLACLTLAAAKYPPDLCWREIGRGRFTVIFPADRWQQAETALAGAESAYEELAAFWGGRPRGRIRIVLDDRTDQANGFATFFPFNLVGVNLAEPPPESELAASRGWLDLVLAHELTHIFHLNDAAEPFLLLRRVFGSQPALYPAVQLPPWVIEGLAVYCESRFTEDGRLDHPPYALMLGAARSDGLFPAWSRISGMPAAWPGPAAKYLFGAGFMRYLSEKYGAASLKQYLRRATRRLVLPGNGRDFKKTFGKPLGKLWDEYRDSVPAASGSAPEPLTKSGFLQQYPCPLGKDELLYYRRDYQSRGEVVLLDLRSGREEILFKMDAVNGLSVAEDGKKILLSAVDDFHAFSDFSDLYEYDLEKGKLKRLSRGLRLSQPVRKPDSSEIFCAQRRDGRFFLALFDTRTRTAKTLSRGFAALSQLSMSPDPVHLAASVKPEGGPWGIGIFSKNGEMTEFVSLPGANLSQPRWIDDSRFCFIQAEKGSTRLASFSLAGSSGGVCDDPRCCGLQQFAVDEESQSVYFTYFSGRGLEIARADLAGLPFSGQELSVAPPVPETQPSASRIASRPYRFWRDLLPRWWSPALRSCGDEVQAGIMTGGQDALGIHGYSLEGYYGFSSCRPNFLFRYVYDGLFPTLSLSYGDSIDYYRRHGGESLRTQELKLASLWPLRIRKRSQLVAYADLHAERLSEIYAHGRYIFPGSGNGYRLGLEFNSAREYYDSISPSDGVRFTLQGAWHPDRWGNDYSSHSFQADLRHYIPLFRPGVLAWRLALARIWNPLHYYLSGGREGEGGSALGSTQPFDLLRGFPAGFQSGDRGWQFNLEYRVPLFKIEKAIMPSFSLDRIWLAPFFDMGRLSSGHYSHPVAYAIGGEAVLRLAFGGAAFTDLTFGVAHGFGAREDLWIYLRMGRSF